MKLAYFSDTYLTYNDLDILNEENIKIINFDFKKYNFQYKLTKIKTFKSSDDRFIIINDASIYRIVTSSKDLAKSGLLFLRWE
ncbi:putative DNA-binding protein [Arcobacter nitrofigilis DSM 7299]|uniref:Putative DNA-binding protein n=1 Tax=Arcobacter nitrofigilis (strain ATCC 33309 / DSM 7299 / CCUG 15893 / LMG 7604 / NCTC 12251 / CI) TaxID=572480 RepID=D5V5X6_ARCNC|nr:hypothetical protein [Arcobacter nitrofigilis]ADG93143.1 putative DNA-binding protein [Arcobacter nitrofigilis DSM 7299]